MTKNDALVDLNVIKVHETPKAILVDPGDGKFWVPKSIIGNDGIVQMEEQTDGTFELTAPKWWIDQRDRLSD